MNNPAAESPRGEFVHYNRAWYSKVIPLKSEWIDEVDFSLHTPGGASGDMVVRWYALRTLPAPVPQLEVFDDAWAALAALPDVLAALAEVDDKAISPAAFCALLTRLGFTDVTPERNPQQDRVEQEFLDRLQERPLPAWMYQYLTDPARDAVTALVDKGLARQADDGSIVATEKSEALLK